MPEFRTTPRNPFWKRYYFRKRLPWRISRFSVFVSVSTFAYYWHRSEL